jgi:hypothetical protein
MSNKPKRKTRLKGTATKKPCVDCGKKKDRFKAFKPRWAGCEKHRTDRGRRFYQPGCADCDAKVNGNIRQPRCIDCDRNRPKKRKASAAATPKPTPVVEPQTIPEAAAVVNAIPTPDPEAFVEAVAGASESLKAAVVEGKPKTLAPESEPVEVTGQTEPSPESVAVPEPAPEPAPAKRPKLATMADLSALFDGGDDSGE